MNQTPHSAPRRVDVIASLESQARLSALDLPVTLTMPARAGVGLETQQLDEAQRAAELAEFNESLRKQLKAEKPTGTAHLFVLDAERLAHSDPQARATLQALANAQFSQRGPVGVAFLPPASGTPSPAAQTTVQLLKETVVADQGAVALESVQALSDWLASL